MKQDPSIGILFTNYQSWSLTEQGIREVLRWSGAGISKIVVVDDASDAPAKFVGSDKVFIHRNLANLGYVRSVNVGMRLLQAEDVVVFFDCDAYPLMDLLPEIRRHFQVEESLGALGFFEVNSEGKTRMAGDQEPTLAHFIMGQALGGWFAQRGWLIGRRFILHSCCMAVRQRAFAQIGGFDEAFDFLDADTDFSMRLMDAGWRINTDASLNAFHRGSGSPQTTARRVLRFHCNRWLLLRKHGRVRYLSVCRLLLKLRHLGEWLMLVLVGKLKLRPAAQVQEKLSSRRQLIQAVSQDYVVR